MVQLFEDPFGLDFEDELSVLDWDTSGARYVTDGSGSNVFRGPFSDQCNGANISSIKWFEVDGANMQCIASGNKLYRVGYLAAGGAIGDVCYIKTKRILGSIAHNGTMTFSLNILGSTKGGAGILTGTCTDEVLFFGLYRDDNNYIGIVSRNNNADSSTEYYHLVTKDNGTETVSAEFEITNESAADILIEIICEEDYVQVLKNGVYQVSNTTNVPNSSELRGYVKARHGALGNDTKIDIDYLKVEI